MRKVIIQIGKRNKLRALNHDKRILYMFFQRPTIPNREDQCASVEPLVDHFVKGPPTHGQPGLSGLVVGGPKRYKNHGASDPKINTCQDLGKKNINK